VDTKIWCVRHFTVIKTTRSTHWRSTHLACKGLPFLHKILKMNIFASVALNRKILCHSSTTFWPLCILIGLEGDVHLCTSGHCMKVSPFQHIQQASFLRHVSTADQIKLKTAQWQPKSLSMHTIASNEKSAHIPIRNFLYTTKTRMQ